LWDENVIFSITLFVSILRALDLAAISPSVVWGNVHIRKEKKKPKNFYHKLKRPEFENDAQAENSPSTFPHNSLMKNLKTYHRLITNSLG